MRAKFFRLAALFCAVLLMVSCLLVSPTPVWARQMDGGSGGGSTTEGSGGSARADEGSLGAHIDRANRDLGAGAVGGAAGGFVVGGPKGVIPGAVAGAIGKAAEGCTNCHDGSRPDKPGTTEKVTLNKPLWMRRGQGSGGEHP